MVLVKRFILPIAIALAIIICCVIYLADGPTINSGSRDALYNDIDYERSELSNYNISLFENNAKYVGDFMETYDYGQELAWEVYVLNDEANVLYSAHAVWVKPGYSFPGDFGEEFSSVEYVVTDGTNFLGIEDDGYTEKVTPLAIFDKNVKLEDIVEAESDELTGYTEYGYVRFIYKNHADMALYYKLCSIDGQYYLNIRQAGTGADAFFKIRAEYVDLLTSAIVSNQ